MKKKIVFTGGGTLGHVMPNLYLIDELRDRDWDITYIGSSGIERDKIRGYGVNFVEIPAVKLVRGKIWRNLKIPFILIRAISRCKKELKRLNPDVVFSKGGYVSLPVCVAARRLKIPTVRRLTR